MKRADADQRLFKCEERCNFYLKIQQKLFGGRAPPGPAEEASNARSDPLAGWIMDLMGWAPWKGKYRPNGKPGLEGENDRREEMRDMEEEGKGGVLCPTRNRSLAGVAAPLGLVTRCWHLLQT